MLDRFWQGFSQGIVWMYMLIIFAIVIILAVTPFTLALMYSNALWMLAYLIVIPVDFGIWNMFF